jgi:L-lactate utilization protein LutC
VTTKEVFLRRLRTAAGPGAPPPHRPLAPVDRPPEVRPVWPDAAAPMTDRWIRSFEVLGGHVHRTTAEQVGATIAEVVAGRGPVLVDERVRHRLGTGDAGDDGQVLVWPGCGLGEAATAVSGVVEATAAIASTGSVVVDSDRNGRLVSLLPRVAVFVLYAADIVPATGDLLRHRDEHWPDGPPSNVVLVTGPSRSGDIEMRLVVGVHGPGEVHAILVDR